jgi:putative acetyltransferase
LREIAKERERIAKLLDVADNWIMLERVELSVLITNPRAQSLYERFGFVAEGRLKGALISHGAYVDEVTMGRFRPGGHLDRKVK